ncbi:chitinase [Spiroplasma helicoides]|uniref:chitinase n=1 Tax=Spiroplasma helicoides TaxID=216938 RepID=A0A1B3SLR2_9MOLU|nr:glycosyl hydrolase family 18 protein [Spiroplasma helicoides]AOG60863.1 chitinase [Spiroplasma helicoides]
MKRLLITLSSVVLTTSSAFGAWACNKTDSNNTPTTENNTPTTPSEPGGEPEPENPVPTPEDNSKVLVGYWYDWGGNYQVKVNFNDIDDAYNVINLSFLYAQTSNTMPVFQPSNPTEVKNGIKYLHSKNKKVLISMGGQTGESMRFNENQKDELKQTILNVVKEYDLDGIDLDWEGSCLADRTSQKVTSDAIIEIKNEWAKDNKHFYITMAPELPYLKESTEASGSSYVPFFKQLDKYYDWINPQFYNGWAWGPYVEQDEATALGLQYGSIITNDDYANRGIFYYLVTKYLTYKKSNLNGFYQLDPKRFVIGASTNEPAGRGAAYEGAINKVYELLKKDNVSIKGLMTWALNYDGYDGPIQNAGQTTWTKWSFAKWFKNTFAK